VAWVTGEAVPEPGRVWAELYGARPQTGLLPFLIGHLSGAPDRPWDTEEFYEEPADPGEVGSDLDLINVGELLECWWDDQTWVPSWLDSSQAASAGQALAPPWAP
jgi:hypothetical protein